MRELLARVTDPNAVGTAALGLWIRFGSFDLGGFGGTSAALASPPPFQLFRAFSFSNIALIAATGDRDDATIAAASSAKGDLRPSPATELVTLSFDENRLARACGGEAVLFPGASLRCSLVPSLLYQRFCEM